MNQRITVIGGAFGSGKTEFSIAYAKGLVKNSTARIGLADLDIVNPYFRSRDVADEMAVAGVTTVSTEPGLEYSDLPALSPRIFAFLQDKSYQVVIDVGGDPVGARALGRFNQYFLNENYQFWVVLNPFRPDTKTVAEAQNLVAGLENSSRLKVTGLIGNINLGRETTLEIWQDGESTLKEIATTLNLPVIYQMVEEHFLVENQSFFANYPVLPVELRMLPPWVVEV